MWEPVTLWADLKNKSKGAKKKKKSTKQKGSRTGDVPLVTEILSTRAFVPNITCAYMLKCTHTRTHTTMTIEIFFWLRLYKSPWLLDPNRKANEENAVDNGEELEPSTQLFLRWNEGMLTRKQNFSHEMYRILDESLSCMLPQLESVWFWLCSITEVMSQALKAPFLHVKAISHLMFLICHLRSVLPSEGSYLSLLTDIEGTWAPYLL